MSTSYTPLSLRHMVCIGLIFIAITVAHSTVPTDDSTVHSSNSSRAAQLLDVLLPDAEGVAEANHYFGQQLSLFEDRALVSAPGAPGGLVYVMEHDGSQWLESALLKPTDSNPGDAFGVAVSLHQNRALIGATKLDAGGDPTGWVYVFDYDGMNWQETQRFNAADTQLSDDFGLAVSLWGDWALVGAKSLPNPDTLAGAAYLFSFDGMEWSEVLKLTPSDSRGGMNFGTAVSLMGNRAVVGATETFANAPNNGAAYVFEYDGLNWLESQKLVASDGALADLFGGAVSLHNDRLLIGATGVDVGNANQAGAGYIFDHDGLSWSETQKITATDFGNGDFFGQSVSIYGDWLVVGSDLDDAGTIESGSAYVFHELNGSWVEALKIRPQVSSFAHLGSAVSVYADRILTGAPFDEGLHVKSGTVFVHEYDGLDWNQSSTMIPLDGPANNRFGTAVSLDQSRALIGAKDAAIWGRESGAAYVFEFDGNQWQQQHILIPDDGGILDHFGVAVFLSGDRAFVGSDIGSGSVYVFEFDGLNWNQTHKLFSADASPVSGFGRSVRVDGNRMLVGAYADNHAGIASGAAYVFDFDGLNWSQSQKIGPDDGAFDDRFGWAVSLVGDSAFVGSFMDDDDGTFSGSVYVFTYDGFTWTATQKLTASDAAAGDQFGISLSVDGDVLVVGADKDNDLGGNSGSVYVYQNDGLIWQEMQKLTAIDGGSNDQFGYSVDVENNRILVGAYRADGALVNSGGAYVFDFDGNDWLYTQKLESAGASPSFFGLSVSLSEGLSLIGAAFDDISGFQNAGAAYVFAADDLIFSTGFDL
jgi:hypothetical protein